MEQTKPWFETWFDSPYYHILYRERDEKEAALFIDNLVNFLNPPKNSEVLDLACGRGRHALYLNRKGFNVTGVDLSEENIKFASAWESDSLTFYVQDMRKVFRTNYFDYVFNLFTSFGYFKSEFDNFHVVDSIAKSLKPGGIGMIDFMNVNKVIAQLKIEEEKVIDGIHFRIKRKLEDSFITKNISFEVNGKNFSYEENVKALKVEDFEKYFEKAGLTISGMYGNYNLEKFDLQTSDRLIILGQKK